MPIKTSILLFQFPFSSKGNSSEAGTSMERAATKHLLPCPIIHHSFSKPAECQHSVWVSCLSRLSVLSKRTRKQRFAGKLVSSDNIKDGKSSHPPPLLHGFHLFQKPFNALIASVIAIVTEKTWTESQEILVGKSQARSRTFHNALPLPHPWFGSHQLPAAISLHLYLTWLQQSCTFDHTEVRYSQRKRGVFSVSLSQHLSTILLFYSLKEGQENRVIRTAHCWKQFIFQAIAQVTGEQSLQHLIILIIINP